MVISVMTLFKVRILQGHSDGTLHVRRSKVYDFAVEDHKEVMKVIVRWMHSTPHGDTTLSTQSPSFLDVMATTRVMNYDGVEDWDFLLFPLLC